MKSFNPHRIFFIILIGLFFVSGNQSRGAGIKSVQKGTATFASGQNTLPVTITKVDTSKTVVWGGISWGGGRFASSNANSTRFGLQLADSTTLNLQRLGSPTIATVAEWYVAEFTSGVSVKRGTAAFATATSILNVTIPTVDTTRSFVLASVATNSAAQNQYERWTIRARLTSPTN